MLHLLCALKPEARPLLDYFDLRPEPGAASIYRNPETNISLTLSGPGKSAAAAAVARVAAYLEADRSHAWLNLGIAGHRDLPLGQAVIVKKVTDAATGQTWFPSCAFATKLPACDLLTLEQPDAGYRKELFDMECAGYFQAVTGIATLELAQSVKIISDNAAQPMQGVNSKLIDRLVRQNLPEIEKIMQQLLALSAQQRRLNAPGPDYHALNERWHFTVSQQHQLRRLLSKWQALHPGDTKLADRLSREKSASAVLRTLRDELDKTPIRLD